MKTLPKTLTAPFDYAVKTTNAYGVIANLDNPVYGEELREMFFEMTGVRVDADYDKMVSDVFVWARKNPDYDENAGRSRAVCPM